MKGLRVLHLLGELKPSGMERMLVSGADEFARQDVHGHVIGVGADHPYGDAIAAAGYAVTTTRHPLHTFNGRAVLRRVLSEFTPDVVHVHAEGNYLQTILSLRSISLRMPLVRTVHNVFDAHGKWFWSRFAQAVVGDRMVRALVVPSPDVAENERRFGRRPRVVYNWVDDRFFDVALRRGQLNQSSEAAPVVLVGNCSEVKNHELVLRAALSTGRAVAHIGSEAGAGSSERRSLDELEEAGLLVARGVSDPAEALLMGGVFAMPSLHEGMPVALAEALVAGLPAVIADAPGLRWAAGFPGVTVVSSNRPEDWADAFELVDPEPSASTVDFRAARGTAEYSAIYRAVSAQGRRANA